MKKKMITVSLAICAFFGARAEETGTVEPEAVRFVGLPNAPTAGNVTSESNYDARNDWPSPLTNALAWSDGKLPHYGPTYIAGRTNGADSVLWTPLADRMYNFDQFKTLILETGCTFCLRPAISGSFGFSFDDLRIEGAPLMWLSSGGGTHLYGKITLADGASLTIQIYQNNTFKLHSELRGTGDVMFKNRDSSELVGNYHLNGMNTNFYGRISVQGRKRNNKYSFSNVLKTTITNGFNLGGNLESFKYDAICLSRYGTLCCNGTGSMELPRNRGLSIGVYGGQITVSEPSGRFTVNQPVTVYSSSAYPSILYKKGPGRLVLGNALRFTAKVEATSNDPNDSKENPVNDHPFNITINEGSLAITHCDALNGAKIAFSNNTEMVMSIDLPEGDMKRYGMRYTKTKLAPFVTDVPVRLVASEGGSLTEASYSVALCTVNEADAEDVADKLSVVLDVNNYKLGSVRSVVNEKENEEDPVTVTFYADILHNGLVISVR